MRERATHSGAKFTDDQLTRMGAPDWAQRAIRSARGYDTGDAPAMNLIRAKTKLAQALSDSDGGVRPNARGGGRMNLVRSTTKLAQATVGWGAQK
jgi:hypothetical protein